MWLKAGEFGGIKAGDFGGDEVPAGDYLTADHADKTGFPDRWKCTEERSLQCLQREVSERVIGVLG